MNCNEAVSCLFCSVYLTFFINLDLFKVIREYVLGILPKPTKKLFVCVCGCLEKETPPQEEDAPVDYGLPRQEKLNKQRKSESPE